MKNFQIQAITLLQPLKNLGGHIASLYTHVIIPVVDNII